MNAVGFLVLWAFAAPQGEPAQQAKELVGRLGSDDAATRDAATKQLKDLGKAAIPELEKAAASGDADLAERARVLLKVIPVRLLLTPNLLAKLPGLDERLAQGKPHEWTKVLLEISEKVADEEGGRGGPQDLPFKGEDVRALLLPAIEGTEDRNEWDMVFYSVSRHKLRSCMPTLLPLLKQEKDRIRENVVHLVVLLNYVEALGELRLCLKDPNARIRDSAVGFLAKAGGPGAMADMAFMSEDPDPGVRATYVFALAQRRSKDAVPFLLKYLSDPEPQYRSGAAIFLGWMKVAEAVPALIGLLSDPKENVRCGAINALASMGAKEAAPAIAALLHDPDSYNRRRCLVALSTLKGKDSVPDLEQGLLDEETEVKQVAVEELGRLDARESVPALCKLLPGPDAAARRAAAALLCRWKSPEGIRAILAASTDLFTLNMLRRPTTWIRLEKMKSEDGPFDGTRSAMVERIAKRAMLGVDWPKDPRWVEELRTLDKSDRTLLALIRGGICDAGHEFLLEETTIRVVTLEEARSFWAEWWEKQEKK